MSSDGVAGLDVAGVVAPRGAQVVAKGYLDISTAARLLETVADVMRASQPGVLSVDLGEVSFCDSAGITALVKVRHECDELGWSLAVVNVSAPVRRVVVDLMGLGPFLNVASDPSDSDG